MKKSFLTFLAVVVLCLNMNAQRSKKSKKKERPSERTEQSTEQSTRSQRVKNPQSFNPRDERKIAIASDSGLKSMTGVGLSASYYITRNIAVDAGAGIGFHGFRTGARARYLFLDKKFTPYVGLGLFRNISELDNVLISSLDGFDEYFYDLDKSTYGQIIGGFEFMGDNGFVIGLNLGFSKNFSEPTWSSSEAIDIDTANLLDLLYGSGLATGLRIGWAF